MSKPAISLCMITRNEAEYIGGALSCLRGLAEELIVVDTGSTDRTVEIAKSFGARVLHKAWNGDFGDARNESIRHASGDWILVLDADERIAVRDHDHIRALVSGDHRAYQFPQWTYMMNPATVGWKPSEPDYVESEGYPGYVEYFQVRLFPRLDGLRYEGPVHESIENSCPKVNLAIARAEVPVHHYGKVRSSEYLLRKARLYLDLGIKKAKADRCDPRAVFELAVQLLELKLLEPARELFEILVAATPDDVHAKNMYGVTLMRLGDLDGAVAALIDVLEKNPRFTDAWNNLGVTLLEKQDFDHAGACLEQAVARDKFNANAWANLAVAQSEQQQFDAAIGSVRRALRINPGSARTHLIGVMVHVRRGARGDAVRTLREAAAAAYYAPTDLVHLCQLAAELGRLDECTPVVESRLDVAATDRQTALVLAEFLDAEGHQNLATRLLRIVGRRHPAWAPAKNTLGCMLARAGSYADAVELFSRAAEDDPTNIDYLKNTALACEKLGMSREAVRCYRAIAEIDPGQAEFSRRRVVAIRDKAGYPAERGDLRKADAPAAR